MYLTENDFPSESLYPLKSMYFCLPCTLQRLWKVIELHKLTVSL